MSELSKAAEQAMLIKMLYESDFSTATGVALSFLLHVADRRPDVLKATLRHPVDKVGARRRRIIDVLNQVAG